MQKRRQIIIGDVHGCSHELQLLLEKVKPQKSDTYYFLGDLVNRGPDSHGVLDIYRSLPHCQGLLGNHEIRLINYHKTLNNKDLKTYDTHTIKQLSKLDWHTLQSLKGPIFLESLNTLLVHGGLLPHIPWEKQDLSITTHTQVIGSDHKGYKRSECRDGTPWGELWTGPPYVIYGHTPRPSVHRTQWTLGLDTGCVSGGALSACILPENKIIQVPALRNYTEA